MIGIGLLAGLTIAGDSPVNSRWVNAPVKMDGALDDWPAEFVLINKKLGIDMSFMNDGDDLYILMVFNNPKSLSNFDKTGMKLWISRPGKKEKKYGVWFHQKNMTAEEMINRLEKAQGPLPEDQKSQLMKRGTFQGVFGDFVDKKQNEVDLTPMGGVYKPMVFRQGGDKQTHIFEMRIPIQMKEFLFGTPSGSDSFLEVGLEWGGMTKEMKADMMRRRMEMASRVSEGASTFEAGGDDSDSAPVVGDRQIPFKKGAQKFEISVKLNLAENK